MLPTALRRAWLPWLLLIVPTLLVGVAMLWLLRNDRQRLQAARTDTLSRANQAARAQTQLAADNIELLVGEIRDGLIRELSETPEVDLDPLLRNWPTTNPLVAQTFLWRAAEEELVWPDAGTNEQRAFRQRHAALFDGSEPGLPRDRSFAAAAAKESAPRLESITPALEQFKVLASAQLASKDQPAPAERNPPVQEAQPMREPVPASAAPKEQLDGYIAQTDNSFGNSTLNLSQELRRNAYTTNRQSAAEAKRAARGETDLGLSENQVAVGDTGAANERPELFEETPARQANAAAKTSFAASSRSPVTENAPSSSTKKYAAAPSRARATPGTSSSALRDRPTAAPAPAPASANALAAGLAVDSNRGNEPSVPSLTQLPPQLTFKALDTTAPKTDSPLRTELQVAETESPPGLAAREQTLESTRLLGAATTDADVLMKGKTESAGAGPAADDLTASVVSPPAAAIVAGKPPAAPKLDLADYRAAALRSDAAPTAQAGRPALDEFTTAQSNWLARRLNGQTFFLGWWQPRPGAAVRGVELNLPAVLERVQALVPNGLSGESYRLLGPAEAARDADVVIPLSATLPGWTLAAWFAPLPPAESLSAPAFYAVATLLVVVFVGAVLAGGTMFFRQAAAAERDATLKTNFVSNVSHEMKTPLTTIRMYAEMLADDRVSDPEKRRRYFATIGRETTRLARLVNNALDFGRLEAGRRDYRAENIVLGPWLTRLAETHAPRLAEAGVKLVTQPGDIARIARIDADSLEQMTLNLLDNAVKYAAGGGEVELRLEDVSGRPALIVADRGPGVPAAHRERIFERFHRVDEALTAKTQGAGLGLTIARRLARDQGGDLHYRDRSGGGAEFVLVLPGSEVKADADEGAST